MKRLMFKLKRVEADQTAERNHFLLVGVAGVTNPLRHPPPLGSAACPMWTNDLDFFGGF